MSSAVRPMAISPDERYVYLQVSFFHGFVVFDTQAKDANATVDYTLGDLPEPRTGKVIRTVNLRQREAVKKMLRDQYTPDSAHHRLAIDRTGKKHYVSGPLTDY